MEKVNVLVPFPMAHNVFTYVYSHGLDPGCVVQVPFGKRTIWGVVWDIPPTEGATDSLSSLKTVKRVKNVHPSLVLSQPFQAFLKRVASYTMIPLGSVLKMALPALPKPLVEGATPKSSRRKASIEDSPSFYPVLPNHPLNLTEAQTVACVQLSKVLDAYRATVVEGLTGSGKTETCLKICETLWQHQKQVLILVPEIVLAQQWTRRLQHYFHIPVAHWHSALTPAKRQQLFAEITQGNYPVIVGARSALFLPYKNLGMIVVDEEHDLSYKQEESTVYHGRDMAVFRAVEENIPILLLSATPSLESLWNVQNNRYQLVTLAQRYGLSAIPEVELVDLRQYPLAFKTWISAPLRVALKETLEKRQQSLLFLNRRGYASLVLCYRCGYRAACPNCSVWMTVHHSKTGEKILRCHYCASHRPVPEACPECQHTPLITQGAGVDQLKQEVLSFLPEARVEVFSSDTLSSGVKMEAMVTRILNQEVDVLVGTQMVAKGHHFPLLTCVGIVDTDFALMDPDIRGCERLVQLLYQVTGRGGRALHASRTYLQTAQPDHPVFLHIRDHTLSDFWQEELHRREANDLPPVTRFALLNLWGLREMAVEAAALALQKKAPVLEGVQIFGPAPAPLNPLRNYYRWRFLVKSPKSILLQPILKRWIQSCPLPSSIHWKIDIDPHHFL